MQNYKFMQVLIKILNLKGPNQIYKHKRSVNLVLHK